MGYKRILPLDRTLISEYKSLAELRIDPYLRIMEKGENPLGVAC